MRDTNTSSQTIRAVTVGAGRWGALHMEKLKSLEGVELVGVVDRSLARARVCADELDISCYAGSLDSLGTDFDIVTIAVPIPELADVALCAVERGAHILVEKPGAIGTAHLRQLKTAVEQAGVKAAVGFLERFNRARPSITGTARRIVTCRSAVRGGGPPSLGYDLAVHDLDLVCLNLGNVPLQPVEVRETPTSFRLCLMSDHGHEARVRVRTDAQRKRRRIWIDGTRSDLLHGHGDPLKAQLKAFTRWAAGSEGPGRLARLEDAERVMQILENSGSVFQKAA